MLQRHQSMKFDQDSCLPSFDWLHVDAYLLYLEPSLGRPDQRCIFRVTLQLHSVCYLGIGWTVTPRALFILRMAPS